MVSRELARFLVSARERPLTPEVVHEAKRSLVNVVGTALGGAPDAACAAARRALLPFSAPAQATLIGRTERANVLDAAFLNAVAGNVLDFDDTHPGTIIHPSAPVGPPLFAFAEHSPLSGADLLRAFVLGVEVECRLGNAVSPHHYAKGWHITATCGVFGAAAAMGTVLALDEDGMLWALGHASAQSSGLVETLGTMAKSTGMGQSARGGLVAALLAREGMEGPERPIEGPRGFLAVLGDGAPATGILDDLGTRWEILRNTYKPYPSGVVLNPVIDAVLALRQRAGAEPERIAAIRVLGHPLLRQRADRPEVTSGREAQVSAHHAVAVALLDGRAGTPEFSDARVRSPDVLALRAKVSVAEETGHTVDGARVEIVFADGATLSETVTHARGSAGRPLTDAELSEKFRTLAASGCPGLDPEPLLAALWRLDHEPAAGAVIRLAAGV